MFGLGVTEMVIVLVIVVVLFGGSKLPQLGKGIGEAISNFKKASSGSEPNKVTADVNRDNKEIKA